MNELFDRLFALLGDIIGALKFWHVLNEDEIGLIQRLGKYQRDMSPGFNWKWPVLESANYESGALDSTVLREQTLTTSDGKQVTLRGVLTYRAADARKYILDCEDAESVVNDVGCCVVAETVPTLTLQEVLCGDEFNRDLRKQMRQRAKRWGVFVDSFSLMDRVQTRAYRIYTPSE